MKFFNVSSISNKLALLIIFAVIPGLAILLYSGLEQRRHIIKDAGTNVSLLTRTMAESQKRITQSTMQTLSILSRLTAIQKMDTAETTVLLKSVLAHNSTYSNIALVDLKGDVIASGKSFTTVNLADRKHVREAMARKEFAVGEYILTRVGTLNQAFPFAFPVLDKEGRLKAVLTAAIKIDVFSHFYDVSTLPEKSFVAVTDYKGIRMFYYPAQKNTNPIGKPIKTRSWNHAVKGEEKGLFLGTGSDGRRRIFAYEKVCLDQEDTPYLYVWASIPEDHLLGPSRAALIRNLLLMLLTTGVFLIMAWVIGKRTVIAPVQNLVALAHRFSRGDLDARCKLTAGLGELGTLTMAFHDMADALKENQRTLQESEKKYRKLADALPQVVFEVDETGNIVYVNQNAFTLFKYSQDELGKGLNFIQMIIPEDRDRAIKNVRRVLNGIKTGGLEYTALRNDGSTFPVIIHANRVTQNGQPVGIRGLLIDISDQKKMEEDLKRRALAIDHSSDTIVITDTKARITYVNPAFEKITGYSQKEAVGKNPQILQSGRHDKSFYTNLWETISSGKTWSGRFINKKKDGSHYTEEATISPVFSGKGEIINYVAVKRDISEKLRLEAELQQVQKMESIGTLAGGIAHDFNNILFPLVGHVEMLLTDIPENSPHRNSLTEIYTGALRARDLVKQILTFSRQENSELRQMKMQPVIEEALKLIRSSIPATIEIKQDISPACGGIKADPIQIHQLVMNLATNAYHAMADTVGELKVTLKEVKFDSNDRIPHDMAPGVYACLTLVDTGTGMNKALIKKIFDPFFTTKKEGKGTGMGLSVVHGIVTGMGGSINVFSEPGKGTQVFVYLPVEKSFSEKKEPKSTAEIKKGTEQILLVDDEKAILTMEKRMLERLGYQVSAYISSLEALEAFRAMPDKFDLIITDMAMPNMPGDKLSGEFIRIRPDISILLCTGFSETMSEKKALSIGIKGFLFKPIEMRDLSQKIREVLDERLVAKRVKN